MDQRDMMEKLTLCGQIRGRCEAGKFEEVVIEVGLIVVAAFEGHVGPVQLPRSVNLFQCQMKALEAMEHFGRHANLRFKKLSKPAGTETGLIG